MVYFIGSILLIITLLIIGLILRKRVYDSVDRQEVWKMDIMNRNTAAELARIKGLNLSGETQEKFESWKDRWEFIVTKELPDIEDYLFEAEEAADRYRFPSAKKIILKIDQTLNAIENDIERMLQELEELIESEEKSREEIEELKPKIKALGQKISQSRNKYGKSDERLESGVNKLKEKLAEYDVLAEAGDYLEAKLLVDNLRIDLIELEEETDLLPLILKMCTDNLPSQLDDLSSGLKGMKDDGYSVEHLGFESDIHKYQQRLLDCVKSLENGSIFEVESIITEMEERIKEMYELLEKEAIAKGYIETQITNYQQALEELGATFEHTKSEVEVLRKAYYFEDRDMERYLLLEKLITQSKNQLDGISEDLENKDTAHSKLRIQLEDGFEQLDELQQKHNEFKEKIYNLRKDELEAKEELSAMNIQVNNLNRKLQKSNLPGVPNFIWNVMESASESNQKVIKALDKQPLDISEVRHALKAAESAVANAVEQTDIMLDQAYLTEQVIQYANRYRSRYPLLAAKLSESERLFRSYEYELSLENAANAIEEIEPGALKKIEANQVAVLS